MDQRALQIIRFLEQHGQRSSKEIFDGLHAPFSYATLKRLLADLKSHHFVIALGSGKSTTYTVSPTYALLSPMDIDKYYEEEVDERKIKEHFNLALISEVIKTHPVFTEKELATLSEWHEEFQKNKAELSEAAYRKELERLAIDLSWKSSQIEGNTYTLLETERLLKEKETADGKTREEAIMLLNHKEAIDFLVQHKDYLYPLTPAKIEDVHGILTQGLGVDKNLRKRRISITGTNYKPLDNEFQIKEALMSACDLINNKQSVFEKALLALVLISYIQPFMDGNKRTARIVSNSILMHYNYCPLSYRTVNSLDYKKAMLLFYEQNNLFHMKRIFMEQVAFAVKSYF